jgi:hypothetical protein
MKLNNCDYKFVNGSKKGIICNKRVKLDNKTKCYRHCEQKVIDKKSRCKNWVTMLVNNCKKHDKAQNRYFDLTEKWINKILDHQEWCCFHCDKYLLLENGTRDYDQVSIDRIDNSKGHSKGNVVLSCLDCNLRRRNKDIDIFTPNPKYTILEDDESSEENSDYSEETDKCISTSQTSNQNCNQM